MSLHVWKQKNGIMLYVSICCVLLNTCHTTYLKPQFMDEISLCPGLLLQLKAPGDCSEARIRPVVEWASKDLYSPLKKSIWFVFTATECCVLFSFPQAESPQNSSAHTFSFSKIISKLWRTIVVFYSFRWLWSRLWNTPRLPNGTTSLPLREYFCRYILCEFIWPK